MGDDALIGDEEPETGEAETGVANPWSCLDSQHRQALVALCANVQFDEPMRRHTTLKLGGPADAWVTPRSVPELVAVLAWAQAAGVPLTVVGGGSNLLVRDAGIRGVVLGTRGLRRLTWVAPQVLRAEAGVATSKVLAEALARGLGGVEFLGGVPGSVGGGMIMNAGTYVGEFKDVTTRVESVRMADGQRVVRDHAACGFAYRQSALPADEVVVAAEFALTPRDAVSMKTTVAELRARRHAREPTRVASNGSTFKNPPGDFAGRLIEAAGCKGWREGDAECSPVHANWLVNRGQATARELETLIARVRAEVERVHGVRLELEVKVLGEPDDVARV